MYTHIKKEMLKTTNVDLDPVICSKYARLKTLLWDLFPNDRVTYSTLKGLFIEGVLSAYRQASGENNGEGEPAE